MNFSYPVICNTSFKKKDKVTYTHILHNSKCTSAIKQKPDLNANPLYFLTFERIFFLNTGEMVAFREIKQSTIDKAGTIRVFLQEASEVLYSNSKLT